MFSLNCENIHQVLDLINASIYWKDMKGRYLGCNKYTLEKVFCASSVEEIIGKTDKQLLPKDKISKFLEVDKLTFKNGHYEGEEYGTVNGKAKTYFASKNHLYDSHGNIMGIIGISIDITEQKELEKLKQENQAQQNTIKAYEAFKECLDEIHASIYWKDTKGRYLWCNQYALDKIFCVKDKKEIIGKTDKELLPMDETAKFVDIDKLVLKNGRYDGEEYGTINGEKKVFLTTKIRTVDNQNNVIIFGTSMDITAKKETERLQIEIEKNKAVEKEQKRFKDFILQIAKQMSVVEQIIGEFKFNDLKDKIGNQTMQSELPKYNIKLSKRERQILYYLSFNKVPKEIATIISSDENKVISPATIQSIINKRLFRKLNVVSIGQLIERANTLGLIPFMLESNK